MGKYRYIRDLPRTTCKTDTDLSIVQTLFWRPFWLRVRSFPRHSLGKQVVVISSADKRPFFFLRESDTLCRLAVWIYRGDPFTQVVDGKIKFVHDETPKSRFNATCIYS